ncbi:MAG: DUF4398 domain-containing protein [Betaproteobacteria bacterium]|nr:DUF4398 domain-containing protein [Betaproteobacteria bacterium]
MDRANAAVAKEDFESARWLAEEAQVDARLAEKKAQSAEARKAAPRHETRTFACCARKSTARAPERESRKPTMNNKRILSSRSSPRPCCWPARRCRSTILLTRRAAITATRRRVPGHHLAAGELRQAGTSLDEANGARP